MSIVYVPQTITEETMFPPVFPRPEFAHANSGLAKAETTPFFLKAWRTSRFPTPLPAHGREARP